MKKTRVTIVEDSPLKSLPLPGIAPQVRDLVSCENS